MFLLSRSKQVWTLNQNQSILFCIRVREGDYENASCSMSFRTHLRLSELFLFAVRCILCRFSASSSLTPLPPLSLHQVPDCRFRLREPCGVSNSMSLVSSCVSNSIQHALSHSEGHLRFTTHTPALPPHHIRCIYMCKYTPPHTPLSMLL